MATYTLRVKRSTDVIGDFDFDASVFAGVTRKDAADILLPHVQAVYPQVQALSFPGGIEGRTVKNEGGEILVEVTHNGQTGTDTGKNGPTTTRKVSGAPTRDEQVLAYLREHPDVLYPQACEVVDAAIAQAQAEADAAKLAQAQERVQARFTRTVREARDFLALAALMPDGSLTDDQTTLMGALMGLFPDQTA